MRRRWSTLTLVALAGLLPCAPAVRADIAVLSLWEKSFRADLVIRATVVDGDDRLAQLRVEEVIKGSYDREIVRIVFRARNLSRPIWEEKIEFAPGEHLVLFLTPFRKRGVVENPDQFELVHGYQGKVEVPPEGAQAFLEAVRRFAEIQSLDSQLAIWDAARALLQERNPLLVEAGFQQVLKFRLADESLVPEILEHLESPNVRFRGYAAQTLAQVFEEGRRTEEVLPTEDHVRDLLLHTAMNDPSEEVRVESVKALGARFDGSLVPSFRQIALQDPSQAVRYQAEKAIFDILEEGGGTSH